MPQTIIIETFEEFAARHGGNGLLCGKTGLIVFADGASTRADDANMRAEPPADAYELLQMRRLYHKEALRREEEEFNRAQRDFTNAAALASRYNNLPGPPANAVEILQKLAQQVRIRRFTLASIEKKIAEKPSAEAERARNYQNQLAQDRAQAGELLRQIQTVSI